MGLQFSDKSTEQLEKEVKESNLIPKNTICDFEVLQEVNFGTRSVKTEDAISSSKNPMLVLVLKVYYGENQFQTIIDYITTTHPKMEFKARHCAAALGLDLKDFTAENCVGKSGKCKIGIQRDKNGDYPDRNNIADYVAKGVMSTAEVDDSIPF